MAIVAPIVTVVGLALTLTVGAVVSPPPPPPPAVVAVAAVAATSAAPSPAPTVPAAHSPAKAKPLPAPAPFLPASKPVRLEVGSIGLRSTGFVPLHVQRDGTLSVPVDADQVGFYAAGPTPGQLGSAVLAAHVDTASGREGVFYRLGAVRRGDRIRVTRADGTTPVFTVDRVQGFSKSAFPTAAVYESELTTSQLRLITCGGPLDGTGTYRDNVVVFAHLSSV